MKIHRLARRLVWGSRITYDVLAAAITKQVLEPDLGTPIGERRSETFLPVLFMEDFDCYMAADFKLLWPTTGFLQVLRYKAESAGCEIAEVDPVNTSKMCSSCGNIMDMPCHVRVYRCTACKMVMDRDHNAAINILKKASGGPERTSAEICKRLSMKQEATGFSPW